MEAVGSQYWLLGILLQSALQKLQFGGQILSQTLPSLSPLSKYSLAHILQFWTEYLTNAVD